MELAIDDDGTLKQVFFNGDGCCISQAAASMLVERFDGRTVGEVKQFTATDMLKLFGVRLTPNRQKVLPRCRGGFCSRPFIRLSLRVTSVPI